MENTHNSSSPIPAEYQPVSSHVTHNETLTNIEKVARGHLPPASPNKDINTPLKRSTETNTTEILKEAEIKTTKKRSFSAMNPGQVQHPNKKKKEEKIPSSEADVSREERITQQFKNCFNLQKEAIEKQKETSKTWAQVAVELASRRLQHAKPISTQEIINIYNLFFNSPIQQKPLPCINAIDPHPAHIFKSLFSCIKALSPYDTCGKAVNATKAYINTRPQAPDRLAQFLILPPNKQASLREGITALAKAEEEKDEEDSTKSDDYKTYLQVLDKYLADLKQFETNLKKLPIIKTTDVFKHNNVNETYILRDKDGNEQWIFKPIQKSQDEYCHNVPSIAIAEHTASLVNIHHKFPIPVTLLVEIKGWTGSAQLFIENTKSIDAVKSLQHLLSKNDLQKLVIYDLIFANCDRHTDNILFKQVDTIYRSYGIDHDQCMMMRDIKILKLDYLDLKVFDESFDCNLEYLISEDNLNKYAVMMEIHDKRTQAIRWMNQAADIIQTCMTAGTSIREAVKSVQQTWQEEYLSY